METAERDQPESIRLLIFGDGSVRTLPLQGNRWVIGRAADCDVPLHDPTVSRRHLVIERHGGEFRFQDLSGSNPVLLDGRPHKQGVVAIGQTLSIGLTRLVLERRQRPAPVAMHNHRTVVLSREVADEDVLTGKDDSFALTAAKVLDRIEWTFADLGDLADAAEPLLDLALNLTGRRRGWIGRFLAGGSVETLATLDTGRSGHVFTLPEAVLVEARRIGRPHVLTTQEQDDERATDRLLIPLGRGPAGVLVLEEPADTAPVGPELLRLAQSLGTVVWHRLQETMERLRLRDEVQRLRFHGSAVHNALLASTRLQEARQELRTLASGDEPVLLVGEEGTEREDLARYLHAESPRRQALFVAWNAARVPSWRHEKDLFAAADGAVARVRSGTLFVDGIDEVATELQERLITAMRQQPGEDGTAPGLVAATAVTARDSAPSLIVAALAHQRIHVPPLRGHARDVLTLAELFLSELGTCPDGSPRLLTERTKRLLITYAWPGNIRELRLVLEAAAAQAGNQPIAPRHLPPVFASDASAPSTPEVPTLEQLERQHIVDVMQRTGGNRARTAQMLGIASSTLYEKLKRYCIEG